MSIWIWLLILLNIGLIVFILVRDKDAREVVKKFFSWLGNKIREARIKAKISKDKEKMYELITKLGQMAFEKGILVAGKDVQGGEIETLFTEEKHLDGLIESVISKIEKEKKRFLDFREKQEAGIRGVEEKKDPEEKKLDQKEKEAESLEKQMNDQEKTLTKAEKVIKDAIQEQKEIAADNQFSSREKDEKTTGLQQRINEQQQRDNQANQKLESLRNDRSSSNQGVESLKKNIRQLDSELKRLKESERKEKKKSDQTVDLLIKEKNGLHTRRKSVKDKKSLLLTDLGRELKENRVDHIDLADLYRQIDDLQKEIKGLEDQI